MPLHAPKGGLISHKPALKKKKKKALSFCEKQVMIERHLGLSLYCAINKRCRVCSNLLHVNGELRPSSSVVTFDSLGDPHWIKDITSAIWEINVGKHFFVVAKNRSFMQSTVKEQSDALWTALDLDSAGLLRNGMKCFFFFFVKNQQPAFVTWGSVAWNNNESVE